MLSTGLLGYTRLHQYLVMVYTLAGTRTSANIVHKHIKYMTEATVDFTPIIVFFSVTKYSEK